MIEKKLGCHNKKYTRCESCHSKIIYKTKVQWQLNIREEPQFQADSSLHTHVFKTRNQDAHYLPAKINSYISPAKTPPAMGPSQYTYKYTIILTVNTFIK